jgi:hypothetical protein
MTRTATRPQIIIAPGVRRPAEPWVWRDASDDDVVREPRPAASR